MKKTILILSFTVFASSLFSQKTLSWKNREVPDKVSIDAKKDEAEVRIYSSLPLTFQSITKVNDKHTGRPYKVEKEGPLNVHYFLFSSLSTYCDRKLKISSNGYRFIEIPIQSAAYTITAYNVWDEEIEGVKGLINEGKRLFGEGNYDQAKIKFLDAMERLEPEDLEVEDAIIAQLDNIAASVDAKEKADKLFNEKQWLEAKKEYEKVRAITFDSNVDKTENIVIVKTTLQDDFSYYAIKLSVPSRARRLRMISEEYEAITHQLGDLQPEEIRRFIVNDPFADSSFKKVLKEGMNVFDRGMYEQAKAKFLDALGVAIDPKEIEETNTLAERANFCIDAKAKADRFFNNKQWFEASVEYQKVIGANRLDTYCKGQYEQCMNGNRKISGIVTNRQGQPVSGVSIVFEEQAVDKKGNIKYSWSKKAVKTNVAGKFEVEAWMKTRKLQYWLFSYRKNEIGIPSDTNVIKLVVNDGSGEAPNPLGILGGSDNSGNSK